MRERVLFICTHNSARSQMAEGILRAVGGDRFDIESAGTELTSVRPEAVEAMRKMGIDISTQTSKTLDQFINQEWTYVITVCDRASESCPVFSGATETLHWSFADPSRAQGTNEQRQIVFDETAAAVHKRIRAWLAGVETGYSPT